MRRILLAEDDRADATLASAILQAAGFEVVVEGTDLCRIVALAETADLLVLDVMLDGIDGFEVLRALAERGLNRPVLVITGKFAGYLDFARSMAEGLGFTAVGTLQKPLEATALVDAAVALGGRPPTRRRVRGGHQA